MDWVEIETRIPVVWFYALINKIMLEFKFDISLTILQIETGMENVQDIESGMNSLILSSPQ